MQIAISTIVTLSFQASDLQLIPNMSWNTEIKGKNVSANTMYIHKNRLFILYGKLDNFFIRVFDFKSRSVIKDIKSRCGHRSLAINLCEHPSDDNCILEACSTCEKIQSYDFVTGGGGSVYTGSFATICKGPSDTILCVDGHCFRLLKLKENNFTSHDSKKIHNCDKVIRLTYQEVTDTVVVASWDIHRIVAYKLAEGGKLWEFATEIQAPAGILRHNDGHLYVADLTFNGVVVLDAQSGKKLQVVPLSGIKNIMDICGTDNEACLVVLANGGHEIKLYQIK